MRQSSSGIRRRERTELRDFTASNTALGRSSTSAAGSGVLPGMNAFRG
jgi:hypothetical protein